MAVHEALKMDFRKMDMPAVALLNVPDRGDTPYVNFLSTSCQLSSSSFKLQVSHPCDIKVSTPTGALKSESSLGW
ncbi:hypothetical protein E1B28_001942 [Marasmius oreades]|uniref:Uncharacterized protein n=1 Tax=Marasmius oreades TaxID=181124 RepID=A0A9P7V4T4_9AGAR|nr:uncharacterized protein E1B28_001942 [Marasmius oreades]KAG7100162.1 hypothetical protein E1B28_001942 [Marasmius oreades]